MPVFGKMVDWDVFSRNVMVGGYGENGFLDDALDLYQRMLWAGNDIRLDIYTFPCVLRSCSGVLDLMRKREIHAHVIRLGFGLETDVWNSPVAMCRRCGEVHCARKVFDEMPMKDCILWNGMIFGYLENGERFEELILFLIMHDISFEPELMTTRSVICASGSVCDKRLAKEIHGCGKEEVFLGQSSKLYSSKMSISCQIMRK
ncbi:pentatricopeptide repeat-containing protein At1g15510, chloroplastic-like [Phoenix dactylifera]|uniref:Pentatricopeptide repeat-containing protein At1g15510, chloroplastic-like n=1 Tax=Phoenix dactylifera TaxID=42345 RepID=A0A8B9A5B3_PHODC|nr:pentatricopeptide repeat-containing protein At1g15510, chloroplastic-like [Phoenix dactylifera]